MGPADDGRPGSGGQIPRGFLSPTTATPGSAEKLEIMRLRVMAGCTIFHPDDSRLEHAPYNHKTYIMSLKDFFESAERADTD